MLDSDQYYLAFSLFPGIGPVKFDSLIAHFGSSQAAYEASVQELSEGIGVHLATQFAEFRKNFDFDLIQSELEHDKITLLSREHPLFPPRILEISDPPICLYVKGDVSSYDWDDFYFAVVGTRNPSEYGKQVTKKLSREMVEAGAVIVSGLAMGVDALAHWEAVKLKKKTVAFLGCGVNIIYPSINTALYHQIITYGGLIISEFPPNKRTAKGHFVARNRLISGVSKGVLVAEGLINSGSLITARYALAQGKDVFAPPAPITSDLSRAPNLLIQEGAKMVTNVQDILDEYNVELKGHKMKDFSEVLTGEERSIYQVLAQEAFTADELSRTASIPMFQLLSLLSSMELSGSIERNASGKYQVRL